ncbi:MAG TPA: TIGR02444 family protein [Alphaproteobacteria bacterium]|jgi:uncharacterized protein (TIGR02444 family)
MEFPQHPFWDFALDVYRRPGVSDACLRLQEPYHLDVNLLLFCGWVGAFGQGRLSDDEIARCRDAVAAWHDNVVRSLRAVRRILKGGIELPAELQPLSDELRKQLQAREIDAEHMEQLILVGIVQRVPNDHQPPAARLADAAANMVDYAVLLEAKLDEADRTELSAILAAMFPAASGAVARQAVDAAAP